eukprot:TRINITY_DN4692_c0_g2_i1.p1 TRINITY_DN4692_c0_g2~~TRINITY_DN4692_c0_g2_i1.p1  ORF type:complete len:275 (+),score=81.84 TRINITY_DN4692_c0_g2_i1:31-855(+)
MNREHEIVNRGKIAPPSQILSELTQLGVKEGDIILVHSSLSKIGWIPGSAQSVFQCLLDSIGTNGTIVIPSFTSDNTDPKQWQRPPVPEEWMPIIRAESAPFDPKITPSRDMGAISEVGRVWTGSKRSNHPTSSFSAIGSMADKVVQIHELGSSLGERSPLASLEELNARVLLLGVGFERCTCFHLAEYRTTKRRRNYMEGSAVLVDGKRKWIEYEELEVDGDDFAQIGEEFVKEGKVKIGKVGEANCFLFQLKESVEFAKNWMDKNRTSDASN